MAINGDDGKFEKSLWQSAEGLRGPVESAEYKHIVLGLLFQKYMSDAFEQRREVLRELTHDEDSMYYCGDDDEERQFILEDKDAYHGENVFYVPEGSTMGIPHRQCNGPRHRGTNRRFDAGHRGRKP